MALQDLTFYSLNTKRIRYDEPDTFRYRPEKGWKFMQRLCCAILSKIGAVNTVVSDTVQRVTFNDQDFMERLFQQEKEIFRQCRYVPERIYIGAEDFYKLASLKDNEYSPLMNFTARMNVVNEGRRMLIGYPVTVVPWMKGVFIAPKEA